MHDASSSLVSVSVAGRLPFLHIQDDYAKLQAKLTVKYEKVCSFRGGAPPNLQPRALCPWTDTPSPDPLISHQQLVDMTHDYKIWNKEIRN